MHTSYLSNAYLVADEAGGHAVVIDTGAPLEPLLEAIAELDVTLTHVFNTHEHHDHTLYNVELLERFDAPLHTPEDLEDCQQVVTGGLTITARSTPGHCERHLAFEVEDAGGDRACFVGDALFAGSVGGTLNGGVDGCANLRTSIIDVLLALDDEVVLYPGHTDATTVGAERADNPFVRLWLGVDEPGTERVEAAGRAATLLVEGPDYDGGSKAYVRFDDGSEAIVGGSMIARSGAPA
jgi:glyoxylase-like metal-dependent hydrolase (beta-lactamase superfamily II)